MSLLKVGDHVKISNGGEIGQIVGYSTNRVFVKIDAGNTVWFDRKEVMLTENKQRVLQVGDRVRILKSGEIGEIVGYSTKRVFVKIDDGNTVWCDRKNVSRNYQPAL